LPCKTQNNSSFLPPKYHDNIPTKVKHFLTTGTMLMIFYDI